MHSDKHPKHVISAMVRMCSTSAELVPRRPSPLVLKTLKKVADQSQGLHTWNDCFNLRSIHLRWPKSSSCTLVHWGPIGPRDKHPLSNTLNTQFWKKPLAVESCRYGDSKDFTAWGWIQTHHLKRGLKKYVSCTSANSPHLRSAVLKLCYNICWYGALSTHETKRSNVPAEINNEVKIQTP